jgi:hypothetical protein
VPLAVNVKNKSNSWLFQGKLEKETRKELGKVMRMNLGLNRALDEGP